MMGDRVLLEDFSYSFRQRDRIAIVGNKGVGKSTFLKVLTGGLPLTDGIELYGRVENLGDAHYQTVNGYNSAGRGAYLGVRARL